MTSFSIRCFLFCLLYVLGGAPLSFAAGKNPPAAPPAALAVAPASGTSAVLTWTDQSGDETGFEVER